MLDQSLTANGIGQVRSESQTQVNGFSDMAVFVPASTEVQVTNVVTRNTNLEYIAAPIALNQPYYTDRSYTLTDLPGFLRGLWGIRTPNDDKQSSATDRRHLCFDISTRATGAAPSSPPTTSSTPPVVGSALAARLSCSIAVCSCSVRAVRQEGHRPPGLAQVWFRESEPGDHQPH